MKQILFYMSMVCVFFACEKTNKVVSLDDIFSNHYEHKMISSGPNFPDFNVRVDSLNLFLIALHEGVAVKKFQKRVGWTAATLNTHIEFLKSKDWITTGDSIRPTIFIASQCDGEALYTHSTPIALQISRAIEDNLHSIKKQYQNTTLSKAQSFESMAFFILSDVLLDNWQINAVEREFLKTNTRPERHKKNYYYAIMEHVQAPKEAFGIYGNQYRSLNDSITLSIYGNNRNWANSQLKNDSQFLEQILNSAPRLTDIDQQEMSDIAGLFKPILLDILEKHRNYIHHVYQTSGYAEDISFEEFFIWWYHFIYTETTNMLAENGTLTIPEDGNFYYLGIH